MTCKTRPGAGIAIVLLVALLATGMQMSPDSRADDARATPLPPPGDEALVLRAPAAASDCHERRTSHDLQSRTGPASVSWAYPDGLTEEAAFPLGQTVPPFESCPGLRPGARMTAPSGCTFNFVFSQGSDLFIGTAAHCVGNPGQRVSAAGVPDFGEVVFNGWQNNPSALANDFALIKIDRHRHDAVDPALCTWGGPTDVGTPGSILNQDFLLEYGWGIATFPLSHTRSRIHDEFLSTGDTLRWNGVGSGGDSGAPLVYGDGRAAGIHTAGLTPVAGVVWEQGPTIERILKLTSDSGFNLQLETAPTQWTVPV